MSGSKVFSAGTAGTELLQLLNNYAFQGKTGVLRAISFFEDTICVMKGEIHYFIAFQHYRCAHVFFALNIPHPSIS